MTQNNTRVIELFKSKDTVCLEGVQGPKTRAFYVASCILLILTLLLTCSVVCGFPQLLYKIHLTPYLGRAILVTEFGLYILLNSLQRKFERSVRRLALLAGLFVLAEAAAMFCFRPL